MRRIAFIFALMLLLGCEEHQIYHTYYGDIDTDTISIGMYDLDDTPCYKVSESSKDTIIYYNPSKVVYLVRFPSNDGHEIIVAKYNPIDKCIISD